MKESVKVQNQWKIPFKPFYALSKIYQSIIYQIYNQSLPRFHKYIENFFELFFNLEIV